jgi:hypothetical protein
MNVLPLRRPAQTKASAGGTAGASCRVWVRRSRGRHASESASCCRCREHGTTHACGSARGRLPINQSSSVSTMTPLRREPRLGRLARSTPRSRARSASNRRTATATALRWSRRFVPRLVTALRSVVRLCVGGRPVREPGGTVRRSAAIAAAVECFGGSSGIVPRGPIRVRWRPFASTGRAISRVFSGAQSGSSPAPGMQDAEKGPSAALLGRSPSRLHLTLLATCAGYPCAGRGSLRLPLPLNLLKHHAPFD